jgi:hypothetical protein
MFCYNWLVCRVYEEVHSGHATSREALRRRRGEGLIVLANIFWGGSRNPTSQHERISGQISTPDSRNVSTSWASATTWVVGLTSPSDMIA